MSTSAVILMLVVIVLVALGLAVAAVLERRRNREVLGDERAQGRNSDPDKGPDQSPNSHSPRTTL